MTATDEITALDLERWLDILGDDLPPCDDPLAEVSECPLEAVAVIRWDKDCPHGPDDSLVCSEHLDELKVSLEAGKRPACKVCGAAVRVAGIGPLR